MRALDDILIRTALVDAQAYQARGFTIDEAAQRACVGAWQPYRGDVARRLRDEYPVILSNGWQPDPVLTAVSDACLTARFG